MRCATLRITLYTMPPTVMARTRQLIIRRRGGETEIADVRARLSRAHTSVPRVSLPFWCFAPEPSARGWWYIYSGIYIKKKTKVITKNTETKDGRRERRRPSYKRRRRETDTRAPFGSCRHTENQRPKNGETERERERRTRTGAETRGLGVRG